MRHRAAARMPGVLLVLALAACSPAATPSASSAPGRSPSVLDPSAMASGPPPPPPSVDPGLMAPTAFGWMERGRLDIDYPSFLIASDTEYIVGGESDSQAFVWTSRDGVNWDRTTVSHDANCPQFVSGGATSGSEAVLLGYSTLDPGVSCTGEVFTLVRSDTAWMESRLSSLPGGHPAGIWSVPGGWEAVIGDIQGRHHVWSSPDGGVWAQGGAYPIGETEGIAAAAVDQSGKRVTSIVTGDIDPPYWRLLQSTDGQQWSNVPAPELDAETPFARHVLSPAPGTSEWIAVTTRDDVEPWVTTTWVSADLQQWRGAEFPMPNVRELAWTSHGLLALGVDECIITGSPCYEPRSDYYLSDDALTWTSTGAAHGPDRFVDGPAGVVGVGGNGTIWQLEAYTPDEAYLLSGVRSDVRLGCSPRRAELPPRAIAGIECVPPTGPTSQVGAYLFEGVDDAVATYAERLAAEGVGLRSGGCPDAAGEDSYHPEAPGETGSARIGCFVNEAGVANLRFTIPSEPVYVGILGRSSDTGLIWDSAWEGNLDQPGGPTIWKPPPD
jgi:hypothetical protein